MKNYSAEAEYLQRVRRAVDEQGLIEDQRQQLCAEFLEFIVSDLIPWYLTGQKDFSLLEINRCLFHTTLMILDT